MHPVVTPQNWVTVDIGETCQLYKNVIESTHFAHARSQTKEVIPLVYPIQFI